MPSYPKSTTIDGFEQKHAYVAILIISLELYPVELKCKDRNLVVAMVASCCSKGIVCAFEGI